MLSKQIRLQLKEIIKLLNGTGIFINEKSIEDSLIYIKLQLLALLHNLESTQREFKFLKKILDEKNG